MFVTFHAANGDDNASFGAEFFATGVFYFKQRSH